MKILKYTDANYKDEINAIINRCDVDFQEEDEVVRNIVHAVKSRGDEALLEYTHRFDNASYSIEDIQVKEEEIQEAYDQIRLDELEALKLAADNISRYHQKQIQESWEYKEGEVQLGQIIRPLSKVGIYVPGGKASYPSSVLMNAIPAKVAGVDQIIMCSPTPNEEVSPHSLVAADLAGVSAIYKVGGAQAVAAMAYGTECIPRVDKIVGPGNIYVALAKRMVFGLVDIDMIAGPSEILVVADESANPQYVAADLLSQAEHDEQAVPILITPSQELADATFLELETQKSQRQRVDIIEASLNDRCFAFITETLEEALDWANQIAPEHLELAVDQPWKWVKKIQNAGAVFLGHFTPEAIGDYIAGPNHVLPTSGTARFSSPLGVYDFVKRTSVISYSQDELKKIGKSCQILADMEKLDAHSFAVKVRISE